MLKRLLAVAGLGLGHLPFTVHGSAVLQCHSAASIGAYESLSN